MRKAPEKDERRRPESSRDAVPSVALPVMPREPGRPATPRRSPSPQCSTRRPAATEWRDSDAPVPAALLLPPPPLMAVDALWGASGS